MGPLERNHSTAMLGGDVSISCTDTAGPTCRRCWSTWRGRCPTIAKATMAPARCESCASCAAVSKQLYQVSRWQVHTKATTTLLSAARRHCQLISRRRIEWVVAWRWRVMTASGTDHRQQSGVRTLAARLGRRRMMATGQGSVRAAAHAACCSHADASAAVSAGAGSVQPDSSPVCPTWAYTCYAVFAWLSPVLMAAAARLPDLADAAQLVLPNVARLVPSKLGLRLSGGGCRYKRFEGRFLRINFAEETLQTTSYHQPSRPGSRPRCWTAWSWLATATSSWPSHHHS